MIGMPLAPSKKFIKNLRQRLAIRLFGREGARYFLLYGGSRSGKSFIIIYAMVVIACKYPGARQLIVRYRFNHAKNTIWLDTLKKVLKVCFPHLVVKWNNSDYFITFPNGSEIWIGGLDDKERSEKILGAEYLSIFVNEASQVSYAAFTLLKTRLAQQIDGARRRLFVDENPPSKKHWTYKLFVEKIEPESKVALSGSQVDEYGVLQMNPDENLENIGEDYLQILESMPLAKRRRFLEGQFSDDSAFALWSEDVIARNRVPASPPLVRIVVAIDPAVTSKDTSDETGIVVAGIGYDGHLYVLEDATDTYTPTEWAKKAVALFQKWRADRVVAEVNNGGDLVETVLRTVEGGQNIPYTAVHATRDKLTRAEPVAALYEQNKAHHVGELPELELEQTSWEGKKGDKSPNRIDVLVWAATELIPDLAAPAVDMEEVAAFFG